MVTHTTNWPEKNLADQMATEGYADDLLQKWISFKKKLCSSWWGLWKYKCCTIEKLHLHQRISWFFF